MTEWRTGGFRLRRAPARARGIGGLAGIILWAGVGLAAAQAQGVCDRTPQVRDKLVEVTGASSCEAVTAQHLAGVKRLDLEESDIRTLRAHDFSGLNSLEFLLLGDNSLRELPEGVFRDLDNLIWLGLGGNFLSRLSESTFEGLNTLEGIGLGHNLLKDLPEGIFKGLSNLETLSCAGNPLTAVPETVFHGLGNLRQLSLADSPFVTLPEQVFKGLGNLKYLFMESGALMELPAGIFNGLHSLKDLSMRDTNLKILPKGVFDDVLDTLDLTITNYSVIGPLRVLSFLMPEQTVFEGTAVKATVSLSGALPMAIRVPYSVGGSAAMGSGPSYSPDPENGLLFLAGETSQEITVTLPEGGDYLGKTIVLTLGELSRIDLFRSDGAGPKAPYLKAASVLVRDDTGSAHTVTFSERDTVSDTRGVCGRTPKVRAELLAATGASVCSEVTMEHLAGVSELDLQDSGITELREDDFSGLGNLESLRLEHNTLSTLPVGIFTGLSSLTDLTLCCNNLSQLPEEVFDGLDTLENLQLWSNSLSELPEGIFRGLSNLEQLGLDSNRLTELPEEIFNGLSSLTHLQLKANLLSELPEGNFRGLSKLEFLDLRDNRLTGLAEDAFSGLSSLQDLELSNNPLRELPEGLFKGLNNLEVLALDENLLKTLPERIFQGLHNLEALTLNSTPLNTLPEGIFRGLRNLKVLQLNSSLTELPEKVFEGLDSLKWLIGTNYLSTLPEGIFRGLSNLEALDLVNNGLKELPPGIFHGLDSIKEIDLQGSHLRALPNGVFDDVLDTLGGRIEKSLYAGKSIIFLVLLRSRDPIDSPLKASTAFAAAEQRVVEGSVVRIPVVLSRALPVALRVPYTLGASGTAGGLTRLSPDPSRGLLFRAGETRQEIVFTLPKTAGSRGGGTVFVALGKPSEIGLRRSDGTGPDAPDLPSGAFLIPTHTGTLHTVTVLDPDPVDREPYCLSLWQGAPCSTVSNVPHVFMGPLGESIATSEVVITHKDPGAADCEVAVLFHRGTSPAPAVSFNGRYLQPNLLRTSLPRGGAQVLTLAAPESKKLAAGAIYVFTRSPCTADSLRLQGRTLLVNGIDGEIKEMLPMAAQSPGDWLADGDCQVLTGIFGNGRNLGFASVTAEPGQSAPPGARLDFQVFDLEGNPIGALPGLDISGEYRALSPWAFDRPTTVEMCLDVPGDSDFRLAVTVIGSKAAGGAMQFVPERLRAEPEPEAAASGQ